MFSFRFLLSILTILFSLTTALQARGPVKALETLGIQTIVFGDSWSDNGNYAETNGYWDAPRDRLTYTDGDLWTDMLSLETAVYGGSNYAQWGASASAYWDINLVSPSGEAQVQQYLDDHNGMADPDAIYLIQLGVNDLYNGFYEWMTPQANSDIALGGIHAMIDMLVAAGARSILVTNATDLKLDPAYRDNLEWWESEAIVDETVALFNEGLDMLPQEYPDTNLRIADLMTFHRFVIEHPQTWKIKNVTEPCLVLGELVGNPMKYYYFDANTPTTQAQSSLAFFYSHQIMKTWTSAHSFWNKHHKSSCTAAVVDP